MPTYSLIDPERDRRTLPPSVRSLVDTLIEALADAERRGAEAVKAHLFATLGGDRGGQRERDQSSSPRSFPRRSDRVEALVRAELIKAPGGLLMQEVNGRVMARDGRIKDGRVRAELHGGDGVSYFVERGRWHIMEEPAGRADEASPPTLED